MSRFLRIGSLGDGPHNAHAACPASITASMLSGEIPPMANQGFDLIPQLLALSRAA